MTEKNKTMLVRVGSIFLGVATLLLVAMIISEVRSYQYIGASVVEEATISVSGEGEVFAVPDVAEFTVRIEEEAQAVPQAQELATEKTNQVIAFLTDRGITEEDIKTVSYQIYPRYDYRQPAIGVPGERVLEGYVVSQGIQVKVREVETAGELLSGVGALAVSNVSGLQFTVDDEEEAKDEARREAIADAKEKAEELAGALGVDLVQVVSFQESGDDGVTPPFYARDTVSLEMGGADEDVSSPELPRGENRFTSQVTITYKIK